MLRSTAVFLTKLITGTRPVWQGCDPSCKALRVYFANHGSHLDFATLWAALPAEARERTRPVAAADYWNKNGFTRGVACGLFHALLIPREGITRKDNPITRMAAALREGESLILFPEGTRSPDGAVADFKSGLWHLAAAVPEAELVPVYLQNLNRILPKGHYLPIPLLSTVVFGKPIQLLEKEPKAAFLTRTRQALLSLVPGPAV
ncbi:MAG: Acyltransferase [Verrucomicrobiales bacterium]|nr:Acyltransferase [Verrucomicrobiales bacterium]